MSKVFENANYYVAVVKSAWSDDIVKAGGAIFSMFYMVVNKDLGVIEYKTNQLPEAIMAAEQLDVALQLKPWEEMRAQAIPPSVNPDGSPAEVH